MTKSQLIEILATRTRLTQAQAESVLNTILKALRLAMATGDRIEIRGFGVFEVRSYRAYEGRNPRTGAEVHVPSKRLPFFRPSPLLLKRINAPSTEVVVEQGPSEESAVAG